MTSEPRVVVHPTAEALAAAVAARLVTTLVDAQSEGRVPQVVLTGGTIAREVHRAVRDGAAAAAVDWASVEFWFGDERFVPADDAERNEKQTREDLLDALPVEDSRVHPVAASDGAFGDDLEAAAAAYAEELAAVSPTSTDDSAPLFDVLMLGVGPDGHVASLFPDHPAASQPGTVVAVRQSPKPPPLRVSMTFATLARAREVWFLASGEGKSEAVGSALGVSGPPQLPASRPRGHERTLWLLDADAAAALTPRG
jgi:6-phosphogluconolactonase